MYIYSYVLIMHKIAKLSRRGSSRSCLNRGSLCKFAVDIKVQQWWEIFYEKQPAMAKYCTAGLSSAGIDTALLQSNLLLGTGYGGFVNARHCTLFALNDL